MMKFNSFKPCYINLYKSGNLRSRIKNAFSLLESCRICPRNCGVDRLTGEKGFCGAREFLEVSAFHPHFGEEGPLVGARGSGTIFLTHCNLKCVFCQNYPISHLGEGKKVSGRDLANIMLNLQSLGCHNINFVTPTHYVPQIIASLPHAIKNGLNIPLVYNCGGYESIEILKILEDIFDIYMPDFKFANPDIAKKFSKAYDYPKVAKAAILEMYRQVGDLVVDERGTARRGLIVRHLVLPNKMAGTEEVVKFISEKVSTNTYVNIMSQYYPCQEDFEYPALNRRVTPDEYQRALKNALDMGLKRIDGLPAK